VGPGGTSDQGCASTPAPGVFFPAVQCEWLGPPAGDAFPAHVNVLTTPLVAPLDDRTTPSIVFTSYNNNDDHGTASCAGSDPRFFGVIRVIDGRTCQQRATIAAPSVIGSAQLAIGDLGGDDATPEIVAARSQGGLVAFTHRSTGWAVLWQTTSTLAAGLCDWAGPVIHDLDDDGLPEVIFYGAVYNGQTGATIDESVAAAVDSTGAGYLPVVADVDGDGVPELVTAPSSTPGTSRITAGRPSARCPAGSARSPSAISARSRDRPGRSGARRRHRRDRGRVRRRRPRVQHRRTPGVHGELSRRPRRCAGRPARDRRFRRRRPGRDRLGGIAGYHVFDPDCQGTPDPASCASLATDGVLWVSPIQNRAGNLGASAAFRLRRRRPRRDRVRRPVLHPALRRRDRQGAVLAASHVVHLVRRTR